MMAPWVDQSDLRESAIRKLDVVVADHQRTVGIINNRDLLADRYLEQLGCSPCNTTKVLLVRSSFQAQTQVQIFAICRRLAKRVAIRERSALPSASVAALASRSSLSSRSCKALLARATPAFAGLELAGMMRMFNAHNTRPNSVMASPPRAPGWLTRKIPCPSL
jgi:hypothetical protein